MNEWTVSCIQTCPTITTHPAENRLPKPEETSCLSAVTLQPSLETMYVYMYLCVLWTLDIHSHTTGGLLCLASFTHDVFSGCVRVDPCVGTSFLFRAE